MGTPHKNSTSDSDRKTDNAQPGTTQGPKNFTTGPPYEEQLTKLIITHPRRTTTNEEPQLQSLTNF